jgi:hypothetical protein
MLGLSEKLDVINSRVGFNNLRFTLGKQIGITARGYDEFKERVISAVAVEPKIETDVYEFWVNLLLSGKRFIRLNYMNPEETASIAEWINNSPIHSGDFSSSYPWPLDDTALTNQGGV